jgi:DNA-binding NtrC family response regulator
MRQSTRCYEVTILIADDEPVVTAFAARILGRENHEVISAETGEEALKLFKERGSAFDLVISDVSMPGIDGIELARYIGRISNKVPVILMSGFAEASPDVFDRIKNGRLDKYLFLEKPFFAHELFEVISAAVSQ